MHKQTPSVPYLLQSKMVMYVANIPWYKLKNIYADAEQK